MTAEISNSYSKTFGTLTYWTPQSSIIWTWFKTLRLHVRKRKQNSEGFGFKHSELKRIVGKTLIADPCIWFYQQFVSAGTTVLAFVFFTESNCVSLSFPPPGLLIVRCFASPVQVRVQTCQCLCESSSCS